MLVGRCTSACAVGFFDCVGMADGCETNGTQDAANCGACGHDCLGGACVDSVCQAVTVATAQVDVGDIEVDATYVYWTNRVAAASGGSIRRADKNGGPATTFSSNLAYPSTLASDATNVYVLLDDTGSSNGQLLAALKSDGSQSQIRGGLTQPSALITDGTWLYFYENGDIRRTSPGGSPFQLVVSPSVIWQGLAVSDGYLYWAASSGKVYAAEAMANATIIDLGSAFVTVNVAAVPGAAIVVNLLGEVVRWTLRPTTEVVVDAVGTDINNDIAVDGDIAWVTSTNPGRLVRVDLLTGQVQADVMNAGKARFPRVGDDAIYWWDAQFGSIMKVAK